MLNGVVCILILILFVGYVQGMRLVCPRNIQRTIRANELCKNEFEYHCLYQQSGEFIEICVTPVLVPAGKYPVYSKFADNGFIFEDCHEEYYQPVPLMSNKFYMQRCSRMKSLCNSKGELICDDGSATSNRLCLCNYTAGFNAQALLVNKENKTCFNKNSEVGGCYEYDCPEFNQELNPAYKCVNKCPDGYYRPFREFDCSRSSVETETSTVFIPKSTTSDFPTKMKIDDDNFGIPKIATIGTVILLLVLCLALVFCFCRSKKGNNPDGNIPGRCKKGNNPDGNIPESLRMDELRSSKNDNGARPNEQGGGIKIDNLHVYGAENVTIGDGVTLNTIRTSSNREDQVSKDSKRQVSTGSTEQISTGSKEHISTGSKEQISTGSKEQLLTGSEEQISTDSKMQVSTKGAEQLSNGNEIQEPEGCEMKLLDVDESQNDDNDDDDDDDEKKPLLSSKIVSKADLKTVTDKFDSICRTKFERYVKDVPADGHCLYHAFITQIQKRYPKDFDKMGVKTLRRDLVNFLEKNPKTPSGHQYKDFLPHPNPDGGLIPPEDTAIEKDISGQREQRWQHFLNGIKDGDWGGSLEIQGLSQLFNVPINVLCLNNDQDDLIQHNFNSGLDDYKNAPVWLGHISLEGRGYHFVVLLPLDEL